MAVQSISVPLPVFLPGNSRDWNEVRGKATITDDGRVIVELLDKEDTKRLIATTMDGVLMAVSFDYKETPAGPTRFDT